MGQKREQVSKKKCEMIGRERREERRGMERKRGEKR